MNRKIKTIIWPSFKYEVRDFRQRVDQFRKSLCFWQYKKTIFYLNESNLHPIEFNGREQSIPAIKSLLGAEKRDGLDRLESSHSNIFNPNLKPTDQQVLVSEFPTLGALRVPLCLTTIVKLGRPIEDVMATYSKSLRRSINKKLPQYRYEQVKNKQKITFINESMLEPYANARHDMGAHQLGADAVINLALSDYGRLDVLLESDIEIGCHLSNQYVRKGKSYWHVNRLGYTENIFSDYSQWGEVNSINLHLALESAIKHEYDYCDYGVSLARPGSGLIEWKRRRKGFVAKEGYDCFYLKPPKIGAAQFFWDAPIFALEGDNVCLYLGVPADKTDEEVAKKYNEMGYGGLQKVYLKCAKSLSENLIQSIQALYIGQTKKPTIITSIVK